jgi:hypothetical protein
MQENNQPAQPPKPPRVPSKITPGIEQAVEHINAVLDILQTWRKADLTQHFVAATGNLLEARALIILHHAEVQQCLPRLQAVPPSPTDTP